MIIVEANVLLYAYNPASSHHESCRGWLEQALNGSEQIGIPWQTVLAFIRIATNPRVFQRPLAVAEAVAVVEEWLDGPAAMIVEPAEGYWDLLKEQLIAGQVSGPLVTDAALASLAIQNGARLCTTDRDFARFQSLKTLDPRK